MALRHLQVQHARLLKEQGTVATGRIALTLTGWASSNASHSYECTVYMSFFPLQCANQARLDCSRWVTDERHEEACGDTETLWRCSWAGPIYLIPLQDYIMDILHLFLRVVPLLFRQIVQANLNDKTL